MEFKVYQKELELQSRGWIPTFHDVSREVVEIVKESGIKNGTVCIASHHTTCSVMIQECSHDIDSFDLEYLQHDLLDIMRKMIPDFAEEHQYRHPGPIHTQFGRYVNEPGDYTSMNTDGHLRSVFFGRSETMTIKDGVLDGGEFAHIYFIDWDHVRARHRQLNVTVMGHDRGCERPQVPRRPDHQYPPQIHRRRKSPRHPLHPPARRERVLSLIPSCKRRCFRSAFFRTAPERKEYYHGKKYPHWLGTDGHHA